MSKKRTERRKAERAAVKLAGSRLKLAAAEAGGSAGRPVEVTSASVIEPHAGGLPCAICGSGVRVLEHIAKDNLRVVRVRCTRCSVERDLYFRIAALN